MSVVIQNLKYENRNNIPAHNPLISYGQSGLKMTKPNVDFSSLSEKNTLYLLLFANVFLHSALIGQKVWINFFPDIFSDNSAFKSQVYINVLM